MPQCSICESSRTTSWFALGAWTIHRCGECGHRFAAAPPAVEVELAQLYEEDYAGFRSDVVFQGVVRRELEARFAPRLPPRAAILDVGCGNGDFLKAAQDAGFSARGIDFSPAAVALCRSRGLQAEVGDFLTLDFGQRFHVITMWDVVEHLPAPLALVQRARELLLPGGYLVLKTPLATDATFRLVCRVRRLAGAMLQVPAHIQFFTDSSLRRLGTRSGFGSVERIPAGAMRGSTPARSLRKVVTRGVLRTVHAACGNSNLYVWLRAPETEPGGSVG
jgi:SAM-dependent methyltransferase